MTKLKGQSLVEFLIIVALISVAGIVALTLLGDSINTMYSKTTTAYSSIPLFNINKAAAPEPAPAPALSTPETTIVSNNPTVVSSKDIGGYNVDFYSDGAVSFTINDRFVYLPKSAVDLSNEVFESLGSDGLENLIPDIANMVKKEQTANPNSDAPVNIFFGKGERISNDLFKSVTVKGDGLVNLYSISIGNNIFIKESETQATIPLILSEGGALGITTINGSLINGALNADVAGSGMEGATAFEGKVTGTNVSLDGKLTLNYTQDWFTYYGFPSIPGLYDEFNWTIDLSNPANSFTL